MTDGTRGTCGATRTCTRSVHAPARTPRPVERPPRRRTRRRGRARRHDRGCRTRGSRHVRAADRRRPAPVAVDALRAALPRVRRGRRRLGVGAAAARRPPRARTAYERGAPHRVPQGRGRRCRRGGSRRRPPGAAVRAGLLVRRALARQATCTARPRPSSSRRCWSHRSIYQLKEADPHTWTIPRLPTAPRSRWWSCSTTSTAPAARTGSTPTSSPRGMAACGLDGPTAPTWTPYPA